MPPTSLLLTSAKRERFGSTPDSVFFYRGEIESLVPVWDAHLDVFYREKPLIVKHVKIKFNKL